MLKVYPDSKNYTATVVKIKNTFPLPGLDNLVGVSVFGNVCIIPKSYDLNDLYIFFPSETALSNQFLSANNLYRNSNFNSDQIQKGYFEENGRVKAIKLKGNKSTGVVMPTSSLSNIISKFELKEGDEFNAINDIEICRKYVVNKPGANLGGSKPTKVLDEIIDSKMFPEHFDTAQLLRNLNNLNLTDRIVITLKLHGTSARVAHTLIKKKLKWYEKLAIKLGIDVKTEEYGYVVGSRRVVKSINMKPLSGKQHFYEEDLWTKVAMIEFNGKLNQGEAVYFEIIGTDFTGAEIQKGYNYGYPVPTVFVYRITNINSQGIEVDLSWEQVMDRCFQLGVNPVPMVANTMIVSFIHSRIGHQALNANADWRAELETILKKEYMDKTSYLDSSVIEEGICVRKEAYPTPQVYKMKAPLFLLHETQLNDKEVVSIEDTQS